MLKAEPALETGEDCAVNFNGEKAGKPTSSAPVFGEAVLSLVISVLNAST